MLCSFRFSSSLINIVHLDNYKKQVFPRIAYSIYSHKLGLHTYKEDWFGLDLSSQREQCEELVVGISQRMIQVFWSIALASGRILCYSTVSIRERLFNLESVFWILIFYVCIFIYNKPVFIPNTKLNSEKLTCAPIYDLCTDSPYSVT